MGNPAASGALSYMIKIALGEEHFLMIQLYYARKAENQGTQIARQL